MRSSGVLMHITSLPGPYGVGTMGRQAYEFVDFLKAAGQKYWQMLPLNPTGYGDSPYQSCSAYAGNPYLIDLELLVEEGLLSYGELDGFYWGADETRVDFGAQYQNREQVLRLAHSRFEENDEYEAFCRDNSAWLADFALYMALKKKYNGAPWFDWVEELKFRDPDALWNVRREMKDDIRFYNFQQYVFDKQWRSLRDYAHANGVEIIGDVPIYVPHDSVEVWSSPELFQLDERLNPTAVAGVPPDAFTADGQLWGNPLYRWDVMAEEGYGWWLRRLEAAGKRFDVIRLDHFRGFESYWSVPYGDETARNGHWVKGPDMDFIGAIQKGLPHIRFIAEDLGFLTQAVLDMRDNSGYPGMMVLQFAFGGDRTSEHLPYKHIPNTVCYIGTHDNMPMLEWLNNVDEDTLGHAAAYMHLTEEEGFVWGMIRTALASVSDLAVLQMQDLLELGEGSRMNSPGVCDGTNWVWRAKSGVFTAELAEKLNGMTRLYGR